MIARQTAIVGFIAPGAEPGAMLALDVERQYAVTLTIDNVVVPASRFTSPFGDEGWRKIVEAIRLCAARDESHGATTRRLVRRAETVREAGLGLYQALAALSPALRTFLGQNGPRRLVIQTDRPEIHALPWEALTNESWEIAAATGLSIVRCHSAFKTLPISAPHLLRVFALRGPGLEDHTTKALESVDVVSEGKNQVGIEFTPTNDLTAKLVHIVAHGDNNASTLNLGGLVTSFELAAMFKDRLMVLLWSCFSAMVHAWEPSPVMALHQSGNTFVLGFTAPLHFKSSGAIAKEFYDEVFGAKGHSDPELAITAIRARRFDPVGEFRFCDWASLTLWMQQPVDLSRLPLGRVRVPEADWTDADGDIDLEIKRVFGRDAALGDVRLIRSSTLHTPIPKSLVRRWPGPVVHLDADLPIQSVFEALGVTGDAKELVHPADYFLKLIEHLSEYRYALLIWTNVKRAHALLVQTLDRVPPNVAIVLMSPHALDTVWKGRVLLTNGHHGGSPESEPTGRAYIAYLIDQERFEEAIKATDVINPDAELLIWRYRACAKLGKRDLVTRCIAELRKLDPIEATLLDGNWETRQTEPDYVAARDHYQDAVDQADVAGQEQQLARARQELAYIAQEMGDRGLAEQLYLAAIDGLNGAAHDADRTPLWTSALGRALRDYGHFLAEAGDSKALRYIVRATAIHAWEGRVTQVAYCFLSRATLMCELGRYDEADRIAQEAAIAFDAAKNEDGWLGAVRLIAQVAVARHRYDQARAVLLNSLSSLSRTTLLGRALLQLARTSWVAGRLDDAGFCARRAKELLSETTLRERVEAVRLVQAVESLTDTRRRVAALSGRLLDEWDPASRDRIRSELPDLLRERFVADRIELLICSAARGADLLALKAALSLKIACRVILPFSREEFEKSSVGPDWEPEYREVLKVLDKVEDSIVVIDEPKTYRAAAERIIADARAAAHGHHRAVAYVVWDGKPRAGGDLTAEFKQETTGDFEVVELIV